MIELSIKIRDIHESGDELSLSFDRPFLKEALGGLDADLERSHVSAALNLWRTGENVFVRGELSGEIFVPCGRCLKPAHLDQHVPLNLTVTPETLLEPEEVSDDVEYFTHDGTTVELDQVLREALILAVPMNAYCREDCKGLCPVCGVDRNETACACQPIGHPGLQALKSIKI